MIETEKTTTIIQNDTKKTTSFLLVSFFAMIVICIGVLFIFAKTIGDKNEDAINKIGEIYMSGMNEKTSLHFETTISQQLDQLESILRNNPPATFTYNEAMFDELTYEGKIRDFEYLALMDGNGNIEMIYGDYIHLADPDPFVESMRNKEKKIAVGETESGKVISMLGIAATYPMENGKRSMAIVAGVPVDFIALDKKFNRT